MTHECFYCRAPVSEPWEFQRDHFPVPESCGGTETVIACVRCHHMKDRASPERLRADVDPLIARADSEVVWPHLAVLQVFEQRPTAAVFYAALMSHWEDLEPPFRWYHSRLLANLYRAESDGR